MRLANFDTIQDEFTDIVMNYFTESTQNLFMNNVQVDQSLPYTHTIFNFVHASYDEDISAIGIKGAKMDCTVLYCCNIRECYGGTTGFSTPYQFLNSLASGLVDAVYGSAVIQNTCSWREFEGITYEVKPETPVSYNISAFSFSLTTHIINS